MQDRQKSSAIDTTTKYNAWQQNRQNSLNALVVLGSVQPDSSHDRTGDSRHDQRQPNATGILCFTLYQVYAASIYNISNIMP